MTTHRTADSVVVRETIRDTIVEIAPDSSMISALLECDSLGRVHIKELLSYRSGDRIKPPDIRINERNELSATATVDSLHIYMQLKERYKETVKKETITKEVAVNYLTWWQKLWCTIGKLFSILFSAIIIYKLWKLKF